MMSDDQAECRGHPVMCCLSSAGQVTSQVIGKSGLDMKLKDGETHALRGGDARGQGWGDAVVGTWKSEVKTRCVTLIQVKEAEIRGDVLQCRCKQIL